MLAVRADVRMEPNAAGGEVVTMIDRITFEIWRIWTERKGQDLVEYALAAAFVAVTVSAFLPPALIPSVSQVFSKIESAFASQPGG